MKLLILNGPNLNRLGRREPEVYGSGTLDALADDIRAAFPAHDLTFAQHNGEGALIDALHAADDNGTEGIVLNPAGYSHTSVALRDAIAAIDVPVVEVHLSNTAAREAFRHHSYVSAVARGTITGLGRAGYHLAVRFFVETSG